MPTKGHNKYDCLIKQHVQWGKDCSSPIGQKLREMYSDPHNKPVVQHIANTLGITRQACCAAIRRFGLQKAECFRDESKSPEVRQHENQKQIPIIYGRNPTLPPLPSLQGFQMK